jgi:hypothetical protein
MNLRVWVASLVLVTGWLTWLAIARHLPPLDVPDTALARVVVDGAARPAPHHPTRACFTGDSR